MIPVLGDAHLLAYRGLAALIQSALVLGTGLVVGRLLRPRSALLRSLVYRAALVGAVLTAILSIALAGQLRAAVYLSETRPALPATLSPELSIPTGKGGPVSAATPSRAATRFGKEQSGMPLPALEAAGVTLWAAGTVTLLLWLGGCAYCLRRLRRAAQPVPDPAVQALLGELCALRGVRPPLLLASRRARGPFVTGVHRPAVVLPADAEFDPATLRAVLAHELAHVARRDLAWGLFARVVCAIAWPQPLAWALLRKMEDASEEVCDEEVLRHDCPPRQYARCLVDLAERFLASTPARVLGTGVAPRGSSLEARVRRVLNFVPLGAYAARGLRLPILIGAGLGVTGSLLLVSAVAPGSRSRGAPVLPPAPDVRGRVLHADGTPAVGIRVFAVRSAREPSPRGVSPSGLPYPHMGIATTDRYGEYRLTGLYPGVYQLGTRDQSRQEIAAVATAWLGPRELARPPDIRLTPGVALNVLVTDLRSGAPLEGVHLRSFGPHHPAGSLSSLFSEMSGPDGRCRLHVLPGPNELVAVSPAPQSGPAAREAFRVPDRKGFDVVFRVDGARYAPAVLTGHVRRPDGSPAPGVQAIAQVNGSAYVDSQHYPELEFGSAAKAVTAADGSYRLTGLMTARYNVAIEETSNKLVAAAAEGVEAQVGETGLVSDLVLTPGAIVEGTVTDAKTGQPLIGSDVASYGPHRPRSSAMVIVSPTDEHGFYRLRVAPGTSYLYARTPHGETQGEKDATVTLMEGETRRLDFHVTEKPWR
jgi:protocatechuate 3,4-dioxygenase beta subunit/Zn-dependent protease with chaperone function